MARNLTSQLSLHELPKDQWRHPGTTVEQTYEIENISQSKEKLETKVK